MDEVSGLLSAARLATSGALEDRFASVQRGVDGWLSVVTGLPRPDRYAEVRARHRRAPARDRPQPGPRGRRHRFQPRGRARPRVRRPPRSQPAHAGRDRGGRRAGRGRLGRPDGAVAAGARARRRARAGPTTPAAGGGQPDAADPGLVREGHRRHGRGLRPHLGLHFLPEDQLAVDRALVAGRTLVETGESAISRALSALVDAVLVSLALAATPRRAGRARRR